MRIDKLEAFLLRLPLAKPFVVADRTIDSCETIYLSATSGDLVGWSEVTPGNLPWWTEEWTGGVFQTLRTVLLPMIGTGHFYESAESILKPMESIHGNRHGKALIEMAWQDLNAKKKGIPLWKGIGGEERPIEAGLVFDRYPTHKEYYAELHRALDEKFHRITVKMRPGWDVQAVNATRDLCPWPTQIAVDIEGALTLDQQSDLIYRLQDFMPLMIEQPLAPIDLVSHAMLQDGLRFPVSLDESIPSLLAASIAADLGSGRVFCLKAGAMGGLSEAKKIHDLAKKEGIPCYAGFEIGTSVAFRHHLALASLPGAIYPADTLRFGEIFTEEPGVPFSPTLHSFPGKKETDPPKEWEAFDLWEEAGIGFEPDPDVIEKFTIEKASLE